MKKEKIVIDISYESILRFFLVSFALFFLYYIKDVLFMIFISILLALTMEPAVDKMQKERGIPRVFGAGALFASTLAVIGIVIYTITPILAREIGQLAANFPGYVEQIDLKYILNSGRNFGINPSNMQDILLNVSIAMKNAASYVLASTIGFVGGIFSAILIAVISFYLILEDNGIEKFVRAVAPEEMQEQCMRIVKKIEKKLGHWVIGQVTLGFIVGMLSLVGLSLLGVPYALVLALVAGTFELIPYIGPTLSAIPAVLIGATVSPTTAALTFALYFFIQEFENYLIVPKVMEKSVGLHPVIIIIAAIIGGQLASVAGIILAVPIASVISIIWKDIREQRNKD